MSTNVRNTENTGVAKALRALCIRLRDNGTITQAEFDYIKNEAGDND